MQSGFPDAVDGMQGPFSNKLPASPYADDDENPFAGEHQSPSVAGIQLDLTDAVISQPTGAALISAVLPTCICTKHVLHPGAILQWPETNSRGLCP